MSSDDREDVTKFVNENREFLTRILAHGSPESRGYALAVIAHGGSTEDINRIEEELASLAKERSHE